MANLRAQHYELIREILHSPDYTPFRMEVIRGVKGQTYVKLYARDPYELLATYEISKEDWYNIITNQY